MNASEIIGHVAQLQPRLKCTTRAGAVEFEGPFLLESPLGPFDYFEIRLIIPFDFPRMAPQVWETAGRLPRDIDRHVYSDGGCCITVWESWLIGAESVTVSDFLTGPLFIYFFAQHRFEATSEWPFGEWHHGEKGRIDALANCLRLQANEWAISEFLIASADGSISRKAPCPCGSRRQVRKCHSTEIARLQNRFSINAIFSLVRSIVDRRLANEKRAHAVAWISNQVMVPVPQKSYRSRLLIGVSSLAFTAAFGTR